MSPGGQSSRLPPKDHSSLLTVFGRRKRPMRIGVTFNVRLAGSKAGQPGDFSDPCLDAAGAEAEDAADVYPGVGDDMCMGVGDDEEEFDSPATIQGLAEVLEGLGHEVDLL